MTILPLGWFSARGKRRVWIGLLSFVLAGSGAMAQTLDTLVMGDAASEKSHGMTATFPPPTPDMAHLHGKAYLDTRDQKVNTPPSNVPQASDPSVGPPSQVIPGALGRQARVLLPRTPNADIYGGELDFTMKVDPVNQNYFTIKLSGDDSCDQGALILNCDGFEMGRRHGEAAQDMLVNHGGSWFPGRFWYRTIFLPLKLTKGKQTVSLKLRSAGKIYDYSSGPYIPKYQYLMDAPSWQIYQVYTHVGGFVDTTGEVEGREPPAIIRTTPGPEVAEDWKNHIISRVNSVLKSGTTGGNQIRSRCRNILWLAQAAQPAWSPGYHNPALANVVVRDIDALVSLYAEDPILAAHDQDGSNNWGGSFGLAGEAIYLLYPEMKARMSETVNYGGILGSITRKEGWSKALRASVDAGRFHRRSISNQDIYCALGIYSANKGLELVDSANALAEKEALRYPYEAAGLSSYMGDDQTGFPPVRGTPDDELRTEMALTNEGPVPIRGSTNVRENEHWYGPNWYMDTTKGLTKEPAFVGSDYGEVGAYIYQMGRLTHDRKLTERGLQMIRARAYFRFPTIDSDGYMVMAGTDPIGTRNNFLPGHDVYVTRDVSDTGASVVAHENAPDLNGWFQEQKADGQLYALMQKPASEWDHEEAPYFPDDLAAALARPKSKIRLPEAPGSPDFAWADEEDMVVAAKHGEERFYTNMVWRGNLSINGAATVFTVGPQIATRAEVKLDDIRYVPTGKYQTVDGLADNNSGFNPPDNKLYPEFEMGYQYPIAVRPDLAGNPPVRNNDGGRGTGYTLCYGHWLVGMNGNYTTGDYKMKLPPGFTSGTDMVSGKRLKAPVIIPKGTTVVFYLPKPATIPTTPYTTIDSANP